MFPMTGFRTRFPAVTPRGRSCCPRTRSFQRCFGPSVNTSTDDRFQIGQPSQPPHRPSHPPSPAPRFPPSPAPLPVSSRTRSPPSPAPASGQLPHPLPVSSHARSDSPPLTPQQPGARPVASAASGPKPGLSLASGGPGGGVRSYQSREAPQPHPSPATRGRVSYTET
jgi:hypothetical protein